MDNRKFFPLFIGGLILALAGCAVLLGATMFYGPSFTTLIAAVLAFTMYAAGFKMLRTAERF